MKRAQLAPSDSVTTRGICNLVAGSFLAFVAHVFLKLLCGFCVAFVWPLWRLAFSLLGFLDLPFCSLQLLGPSSWLLGLWAFVVSGSFGGLFASDFRGFIIRVMKH